MNKFVIKVRGILPHDKEFYFDCLRCKQLALNNPPCWPLDHLFVISGPMMHKVGGNVVCGDCCDALEVEDKDIRPFLDVFEIEVTEKDG